MTRKLTDQDVNAPVRAIIVDDEKLGRQLVRNLSDATPHVEILGEFSNGRDALSAVAELEPEVVFLDIKMPGITGMSVARQLLDMNCLVVFVTAFEAHALEAFEVQAFDYLLKPIELDRFDSVVQRIFRTVRRIRLESFLDGDDPGLTSENSSSMVSSCAARRIRIRDGNTIHFIDPAKVIWFEAANQYVQIHALSGNYLISTESLNSLQEKIDPATFVRIHRSSIINLNFARHIRVDTDGVYYLEMSNGDRVRVSRSNRQTLADLDL